MNTGRLVRTFQELVSIDSPSFDERRMADELAGRLKELGFAVSEDGAGEYYGGTAGNLYAYREGTLPGEPLLFSIHMDTVEPARGKRAVLRGDGRIESGGDTVLGPTVWQGRRRFWKPSRSLRKKEGLPQPGASLFIGEERHLQGSAVLIFPGCGQRNPISWILSGPLGRGGEPGADAGGFPDRRAWKGGPRRLRAGEGRPCIAAASRAMARMELGRVGQDMTVNIGHIEGGVRRRTSCRTLLPDGRGAQLFP